MPDSPAGLGFLVHSSPPRDDAGSLVLRAAAIHQVVDLDQRIGRLTLNTPMPRQKPKKPIEAASAESYRHSEAKALLRPDVGTQAQFKKKKPPQRYRYDSSLSPSLEWDGQEQSAAYFIDTHPGVEAFAKNAGLGFAIPYLHNGQPHDYQPDFILRLRNGSMLILETKGFDPLMEIKKQAAERWVNAVNAEGSYGRWRYAMVNRPEDVHERIEQEVG